MVAGSKRQINVDSAEPGEAVAGPLSHVAGFLLNSAGRLIRERIEEALKPLSITPRELGLLRMLAERGPLTQQALSQAQDIDRTSMVYILDDLEKRGLLIRTLNTQDRRSHLLYLTPRGNKTLARGRKIASKIQDDFLAPLSAEEWELMRQSLIKLIGHNRHR